MKIDIMGVKDYIGDMFSELQAIYAEKGMEPFKKPLIYSLPGLLVAYFLLYSPSVPKLKNLKIELSNLQVLSGYYTDYSDSKNMITGYKRNLPLLKGKDEWLNFIVTSTSRQHGVSVESFSAQIETEVTGFIVVSKEFAVTSNYDTVGRWMADIENSPIYLQITNLTLKKDSSQIGSVQLTFKLTTIFAKPDGGGAVI
ncbi:MAG: hypothetical protein COT17_06735 [Elusimicrobia bacterium CG08_land_8_20_14_0_20_51_18]|nr:MAG: hypothetical protein COT17_06735 [Elusimicrobia bacterium CG08_land_8_20_14_0_20_51_18]